MKSRPYAHWRVVRERTVYRAAPWIRVALQDVRLPNGQRVPGYHRVEMPEYAVIVAWMEDGRLLFERQYKHGIGAVSLTLPGGYLAKGERPLAAAKRELLEEVGARARRWRRLGSFTCNSNYGCGRAHFFVATGAHRIAPPHSGDIEEMEILALTRSEALSALRNGKVRVLSAALGLSLALQATRSPHHPRGRR